MSPSEPASAEASVTIAADPAVVYALITDLNSLAELGEEVDEMTWRKGGSATPGAVFTGRNSNGPRKWTTTCTVTETQPGRAFAFDVKTFGVVPVAHWRYDIEATEAGADASGCTVTERTWDRRPRWIVKPAGFSTGVHDRQGANIKHIQLTLERLKAKAESQA